MNTPPPHQKQSRRSLTHAALAALILCIACTPTNHNPEKQQTDLTVPSPDWQHATLEHDGWTILIADPTAESPYYQAVRFAHSGMVPQIYHRSVPLYGSPKNNSPRQPLLHDDVSGLADEFDISGPHDFADSPPLQPFLKIGVGWLMRPDKQPYRFGREYQRLISPTITLLPSQDPGSITFMESLTHPDGRPTYTMLTTLDINNNTLTSRRILHNMSDTPLKTEFYSHNFLRIADIPPGPSYSLNWSHTLENIKFSDKNGLVRLEDSALHHNTDIPPGESAHWTTSYTVHLP